MADQLEIISANGQIQLYVLDSIEGVINIGRHSDNDIVIPDPTVEPFCAIINYQEKPYQLVLLTPPYENRSLNYWDKLEFGSYTLILVEGENGQETTSSQPVVVPGVSTSPSPTLDSSQSTAVPTVTSPGTHPLPTPTRSSAPTPVPTPNLSPPQPASVSPPSFRPEGPTNAQAYAPSTLPPETTISSGNGNVAGQLETLPPDHPDDIIRVQLSQMEWVINAGETAVCDITITNAGQRVGSFVVSVWGLDESWLGISQPFINLNERASGVVKLTITPPRQPTSRAGSHFFAILVTSSNYPGRTSQHGATLNILPYYEFDVSQLSPKQQTISWFKRSGENTINITNMGNDHTPFRLDGSDDERACAFEFLIPGTATEQAQQAQIYIPPDHMATISTRVMPRSRQLFGFRKRTYRFTITTTPQVGDQVPRSQLGQLSKRPLIGPLMLFLMTILLLILFLYLAQPWIYTFGFADGGQAKNISNGTPVAIQWRTSIFTTDRIIEANPGPFEELEQPISRGGRVSTYPKTDTIYTLTGGNILSRFASSIFPPPTRTIEVNVNPIAPTMLFEVQPQEITIGEDVVTLSWNVQNSDKIELFRQAGNAPGAPEEFIGDFSNQPVAAIQVTPEPDQPSTTYILKASNVYAPTPTPEARLVAARTPTPAILLNINPPVINEGESATLSWQVSGVEQVVIEGPGGFSSNQPAESQTLVFPPFTGDYTLRAGNNFAQVRIEVIPATPEPDAPQIISFSAQPNSLVEGDEDRVKLSWQISDNFTRGEISSPDHGIIPFTDQIGSLSVIVSKSVVFALTAFNLDKQTSRTTQVEVLTPTPTTTATPSPTPPPPTATPVPQAVITLFQIKSPGLPKVQDLGGTNPHKYQVQINTGVVFEWNVENAVKVTLTEPKTSQEVGAIGQTSRLIEDTGILNYVLIAENSEGKRIDRSIEITVVPQPPPDPPFDLIGTEMPTAIKLDWKWNSDPDKTGITGYRVYRADVPGTSYQLVQELTGEGTKTWTDQNPGGTCGKAYLVRAMYKDLNGAIQESTDSNNWQSTPCP